MATNGAKRKGGVDEKYIAEQPGPKAAALKKLRSLVVRAIPDADVSIKWGVPIYQRNGKNVCALASFKEDVALNIFAPPTALKDPKKKLSGEGKGSRMYKVRTAAEIDEASVLAWLKAASG
jgi:hypothetical protein